jgi:uncharacterized protein (TIGR02147 family)
MNIFSYLDYRLYIGDTVLDNSETRGYQSLLAKKAGCQRSYLSQVIHGTHNLTLEQACGLANFWDLNDHESEYFLDLVSLSKAGTAALRKKIMQRLEKTKSQSEDLSSRIKSGQLEVAAKQVYYSAWYWSAIHIALSIPEMNRCQKIADYLGLQNDLVAEVLNGLQNFGLARNEMGTWQLLKGSIHLPKDSPLISMHHSNWRQRAMRQMTRPEEQFNFSSAFTMSGQDYRLLKKMVLDFIEKMSEIVRESPPVDLYCLNVDLFPLADKVVF